MQRRSQKLKRIILTSRGLIVPNNIRRRFDTVTLNHHRQNLKRPIHGYMKGRNCITFFLLYQYPVAIFFALKPVDYSSLPLNNPETGVDDTCTKH